MNNNEYKYWMYFLDSELYAYTDKKEYAIKFEEERDMKLFKKLKKKLTKEEVNAIAKKYLSSILKEQPIKIYNKKTMTYTSSTLIMTTMESITLLNMEVKLSTTEIYTYCDINPNVFNKKIYKALTILDYTILYDMTYSNNDTPIDIDTDIRLKPDELGIFLRNFGKTMKG